MSGDLNQQSKYPAFTSELLAMQEVDQVMRHSETWDSKVDEKNTARLKEIIEEIGWPTASKVGREGMEAAWLLAQHAGQDVDFQEHCLALMQAEPEGEVDKKLVAYLTDRVRVKRGQPQLYGTQFFGNDKGEFGPHPIEDVGNLDERRSSVGMEPFAEYGKRMRMVNEERKR